MDCSLRLISLFTSRSRSFVVDAITTWEWKMVDQNSKVLKKKKSIQKVHMFQSAEENRE